MCTNRFDDDTKNSFVELYTKVDSGVKGLEVNMEDEKGDESCVSIKR